MLGSRERAVLVVLFDVRSGEASSESPTNLSVDRVTDIRD